MKLFLLALLFTIGSAFGQSDFKEITTKKITVNGKLKVNSTTQAAQPCPPMTETQRNAIASPGQSECVYNTTALALNVWNGTTWGSVGGGLSGWVTAFNYNVGDVVIESNKIYKALIAHTSTVFATDLSNGDWVELSAGINSSGSIADNRIVRYDGTTGTVIQSSTATLDDSGNLSGLNNASVNGNFTLLGDATFKTSLTGLAKLASGVLSASALVNADVDPAAALALSKLGLLSGYTAGAGTVSSSDSVQSAIQKVDGNVSSLAASATSAINQRQALVTLAAKGDLYVATASATSTNLGVGENGSVLSTDLGAANLLAYRNIKEDESVSANFSGITDVAAWSKGRNASVMGGGSFVGALARDTSTKIAANGSYKYTQSGGSLDDYFCTTPTTLYKADKGDTFFTASYTYDGATGDMQPYLWDATNSTTLNLVSVKGMGATNVAMQMVYAVNIPDATNSVQLCYQVKNLNSGKILNFAKLQLTKSLNNLGTVNLNNDKNYTAQFNSIPLSAATNISLATYLARYDQDFVQSIDVVSVSSYWYYQINFKSGLYSVPPTCLSNGRPGTVASGSAANTSNVIDVTKDYVRVAPYYAWSSGSQQPIAFNLSCTLSGADYQSKSGNAQVASSNQITSSDSMVFVHKATAIVDSDPIGTFNTFTYAASTNTATLAPTAPTQTTASMNVDGIYLTGRAYSSTSSSATPSRFDIKIGKNLKSWPTTLYALSGRLNSLNHLVYIPSSKTMVGTRIFYTANTGILTIDAASAGSSITSRFIGVSAADAATNTGYFTFNASTQPSVSVIPNASLCNEFECIETLSALSSASGVISNPNATGWILNASVSSGRYTFPLRSGMLKGKLNCTGNATATTRIIHYNESLSTKDQVVFDEATPSVLINDTPISIICSKGTLDSNPKTVKIASSIGVPTVPGIFGVSTGERIDTFSVSYGDTISTVCTSANGVPCTYNKSIGKNVFVSHNSTAGAYRLNVPKTYLNLQCNFNAVIPNNNVSNSTAYSCESCSYLDFITHQYLGTAGNSFGTIMCQGTY